MTLIKSISGIRGTIGGGQEDNLNPVNISKFVSAYAKFIKKGDKGTGTVIVGRDARVSGEMVNHIVIGTLIGAGLDVIDLGLATTPTVEMAIIKEGANGGIVISASHNPENWNALKLLNDEGEFLSAKDGEALLKIIEDDDLLFAEVDSIGSVTIDDTWTDKHIEHILELPLVEVEAIKKAKLKVAIDGINSVGGVAVPKLLKALGVAEVIEINCEPTGRFAHNAEPLANNLTEICEVVKGKRADIGFAVDPDADRLAVVDEKGEMFSEEYTLVVASDYVLQNKVGNTVSNLSSSQALRDITREIGGSYFGSAVGEVNVVTKMKEVGAIIGGEGNGGVIYPELHYGRDGLVGIALILTYLAKTGKKYSELLKHYPEYYIAKNKIELTPATDVDKILAVIKEKYTDENISDIDGVRIDFGQEWIHLRKSNTEPIIRIYAESSSPAKAEELSQTIFKEIEKISE